MERSASCGSLRIAGVEMSHIPKRATQHGIYLSGKEVPPSALKPGQTSLTRQLYTEEANTPDEVYIGPDLPQGSVYSKSLTNLPKQEHYLNPTKPMKPQEALGGEGHRGTAHWRSEYKSVLNEGALHGAVHHRQQGPSYQALNPPTCVSDAQRPSAYHEEYGKYGSNPREKIGAFDSKLPVYRTALNQGTTKATMHIPGYQGFLATNTSNPHVSRVEKGELLRSVDKSNLTQQFHANLVNYAGHVPVHAKNDNGGVGLTHSTIYGHSFQAHNIGGL